MVQGAFEVKNRKASGMELHRKKSRRVFAEFLAAAILTISTAGAVSQPVEVVSGPPEVIRSIDLVPRVFGHDTDGYYALFRSSRYGVTAFNRRLEKQSEEFLDLFEKLKRRDIVDLVHFHDSLYLFFYTEGLNFRTLWAQRISKKSLEQIVPAVPVMHVGFVRGWKPDFGVELSRDRSKLLLHASQIIYGRKTGLVHMKVLDGGLRVHWENLFRYTYERVPVHELRFGVDSLGNACMLDLFYAPHILDLSGRTNEYQLLAVTNDGRDAHTIRFGLPELFIKNIVMEPAGETAVYCAGFCSTTELRGTVTGGYFFRLNTVLGIVQSTRTFEIDRSRISTGEPFGLQADHLVPAPGGFSFLVAEQVITQDYNGYQDILICRFDPNGGLIWQHVIPKEQTMPRSFTRRSGYGNRPVDRREFWPDGTPMDRPSHAGDGAAPGSSDGGEVQRETTQVWNFSSYSLMAPLEDDWIGIAFNEDLRNLRRDNGKQYMFSPGRRSHLRFITINGNGSTRNYHVYMRDRKRKPLPMPLLYYDDRQGAIVMPAARRNNTIVFMEIRLP